MVHFEIPFDGVDRARGSDGSVFGWQPVEMAEMSDTLGLRQTA